jgi:hypothetical protein
MTVTVVSEEALGTGGSAAAGLDEVLATLEEGCVEVLLVADRASPTAGLCSLCGRLSASADGPCQLDGAPLASMATSRRCCAGESTRVTLP